MTELEPHVFAVVTSSNTACELAELLPEGDIAEELKTVLNIQHEILCEMIQGRHFGSSHLEKYLSYLSEMDRNILGLRKDATDKR